MNNSEKKLSIGSGIAWILTLIGLFVIIVVPKNELWYKILFFVFVLLFFIVPIVLLLMPALYYIKQDCRPKPFVGSIPFGGLIGIELLMLIYFYASLNALGKLIMALALVTVFLYHVGSVIVLEKNKTFYAKWYAILIGIAGILFIAFIGVGIYASFYYSILW